MGKIIISLTFLLSLCIQCHSQNCQLKVSVDKLLWQYIWQIKDTTTCYVEFDVLFENRGDSICEIDLSSKDFFWDVLGVDSPFEYLYLLLDTDTLILSAHWAHKDIRKIKSGEKYKRQADISLYSSVFNQFYLQHTNSKRSIRKYIRYLHKNGIIVFVHGDHIHKAPLREAKKEYNEWLLW